MKANPRSRTTWVTPYGHASGVFRKVFSGQLIGNCGYDKATAEAAVEQVSADMIATGGPFSDRCSVV